MPGLFFGIGGGSFVMTLLDSRTLSGRGPGDEFRLEGWAGGGGCCWLPIFSKCDRREETGFCARHQSSVAGEQVGGGRMLRTHNRGAIGAPIILGSCHGWLKWEGDVEKVEWHKLMVGVGWE